MGFMTEVVEWGGGHSQGDRRQEAKGEMGGACSGEGKLFKGSEIGALDSRTVTNRQRREGRHRLEWEGGRRSSMALEKKLRQRRDCLVAFHQCVALVLRCALPAGPRAHAASPSLPPAWRPFQSARKVSLHQPSIGCIIYGIQLFPRPRPILRASDPCAGRGEACGPSCAPVRPCAWLSLDSFRGIGGNAGRGGAPTCSLRA